MDIMNRIREKSSWRSSACRITTMVTSKSVVGNHLSQGKRMSGVCCSSWSCKCVLHTAQYVSFKLFYECLFVIMNRHGILHQLLPFTFAIHFSRNCLRKEQICSIHLQYPFRETMGWLWDYIAWQEFHLGQWGIW